MRRPRGRPSFARRLVGGVVFLVVLSLALAGAGRLLGRSTLPELYAALWHLLGLRVETPGQLEVGQGQGEPGGQGGRPAPVPGSGQVVTAGASVVWTEHYEACKCRRPEMRPAEAWMVGLDQTALARELDDWTVARFTPELVELTRAAGPWCEKHGSARTVRFEGDELMLYAGSLDDPTIELVPIGPIPRITRERLDPITLEVLTRGLVLKSEDDVYRYLEGIVD